MVNMEDDDELLDLVNDHDKVVGTITRKQAHGLKRSDSLAYRACSVFVLNDQGQLWVPRRQLTRQVSPGGLDFSMAEHMQSGEDYIEAAIRGMKEELYLDVTEQDLTWLGKLDPLEAVSVFLGVYTYKCNELTQYSQTDYTGYQWLTPKELANKIRKGDKAKDCLLPALEKFFGV